tara:strand:- start:626 stop:952 length:327 start_codon:yes stop_codon:yes gene_type:complete
MPDIFDDFNKTLKKDLVPILVKYLKDPNNKIPNNINDFLNDPRIFLNDIFEKITQNKDNDTNQTNYTNIENITDTDASLDDDYEDLLKRLNLIEENMIQLEKLLKDKN